MSQAARPGVQNITGHINWSEATLQTGWDNISHVIRNNNKANYAKGQRKKASAGERKLKPYLMALGYRHQRYDPIGYLPDFLGYHIAIEVDGSIHDRPDVKRYDKEKAKRRRKQAGIWTVRISEAAAKERHTYSISKIVLVTVLWNCYRLII